MGMRLVRWYILFSLLSSLYFPSLLFTYPLFSFSSPSLFSFLSTAEADVVDGGDVEPVTPSEAVEDVTDEATTEEATAELTVEPVETISGTDEATTEEATAELTVEPVETISGTDEVALALAAESDAKDTSTDDITSTDTTAKETSDEAGADTEVKENVATEAEATSNAEPSPSVVVEAVAETEAEKVIDTTAPVDKTSKLVVFTHIHQRYLSIHPHIHPYSPIFTNIWPT